MTTSNPFQLSLRVYYEDTDAQGVVYYANYFRFMERARTEWLEAMGINHIELMNEHRRILVVTNVQASFHRPARLGDRLLATAALLRQGRASFEIEQKIYRDNTERALLLTGQVTAAFLESGSMRPKRIPKDFFKDISS